MAPGRTARALLWCGVGVALLWPGLAVGRAATAGGGAAASPAAPDGCAAASPALVAAVEQGLTAESAALGAAWVAPATGVDASFVAAEVMRPDVPGEPGIGVWVTNDAEGRGTIFALDGLAEASSTWGRAADTAVGFSLADPAARRAVACAAAG